MLTLLLASIALVAVSGLPAVLHRGRAGEIASTVTAATGSAAGLAAALGVLTSGGTARLRLAWQVPQAEMAFLLDPLAAAFLLPLFALGALASVYALGYWPAAAHESAARVRAFTGLLLAGMAGVVIAANAVLFLLAWETMAVAAFFLIAAEHTKEEVRGAAWIYLVATHVGTLALLGMFVLLHGERGSFRLGSVPGAPVPVAAAILLLALAGFGFKAGLFPLHFWLPGAHANAPSHVSALLSGAMLKVGVYGVVRVLLWLPDPPLWWGGLLVAAGLVSAVFAMAMAIVQTDTKRALAYSSIENIGIVFTALGLWLVGRASSLPALAALSLAAAIAHVWNHSLFKGLLFLGAGSVLHATGTRRISRMGGLLQKMPLTGAFFVAGTAAAAALPGSNAFVSEWMLYAGLFSEAPRGGIATLAAAVLALAGALALACYVRLTGAIFLGSARTPEAERAHEAPAVMLVPTAILAAACLALGLLPAVAGGALETITGAPGTIVPLLRPLATPLQLAAFATALGAVALLAATRRSPRRPTWDCGYADPSARMQYSAGSIAEWFTSRLLPPLVRPTLRTSSPIGLHPSSASLEVSIPEPVADRVLLPVAGRWAARLMRVRWLQQGRLPIYLLYIFLTLVAAMAWLVVYPKIGGAP